MQENCAPLVQVRLVVQRGQQDIEVVGEKVVPEVGEAGLGDRAVHHLRSGWHGSSLPNVVVQTAVKAQLAEA